MPKGTTTKRELPQLVFDTTEIAALIGECPKSVRAKAESGILPAKQEAVNAPYKFFLPSVFAHFGGNYSLQQCLDFVEYADGMKRLMQIKRLESEVETLRRERDELNAKLQAVNSVLAAK